MLKESGLVGELGGWKSGKEEEGRREKRRSRDSFANPLCGTSAAEPFVPPYPHKGEEERKRGLSGVGKPGRGQFSPLSWQTKGLSLSRPVGYATASTLTQAAPSPRHDFTSRTYDFAFPPSTPLPSAPPLLPPPQWGSLLSVSSVVFLSSSTLARCIGSFTKAILVPLRWASGSLSTTSWTS